MIFGYARVSTDGQTVTAQVDALKVAGADSVFRNVASGAKTDRKELARALAALGGGDMPMVTRLDRLTRSTLDLLHTLKSVANKGAGFRSLAVAWVDATTAHGHLIIALAQNDLHLPKPADAVQRQARLAQARDVRRPLLRHGR